MLVEVLYGPHNIGDYKIKIFSLFWKKQKIVFNRFLKESIICLLLLFPIYYSMQEASMSKR